MERSNLLEGLLIRDADSHKVLSCWSEDLRILVAELERYPPKGMVEAAWYQGTINSNLFTSPAGDCQQSKQLF